MMHRFRKKPVVIDAIQFDGHNYRDVINACRPDGGESPVGLLADGNLQVWTLEGPLKAVAGDWIIKGVKGEYYPCKPDIFAVTYEPASEN